MRKRIRTLAAAVLSLVLLLSLFACRTKQDNPSETVGETVVCDLSAYTIIRPQAGSQDCLAATVLLRNSLLNLGIRAQVGDDWYREGDDPADAKEILIGKTNRDESETVLQRIQGDGFAICLTENKIVITATLDSFLTPAVEYFLSSVVKGNAANLELPAAFAYFSSPYEVIRLAVDGKSDFKVIRKQDSSPYLAKVCLELREAIKTQVNVSLDVEYDSDSDAADHEAYEILVGHTNRPESAQALAGVPADEYVVAFIGHKIILNGWSADGVAHAVSAFEQLMKANCENGTVRFSQTDGIRKRLSTAPEGIPVPSGLELSYAYQGIEDAYESIYSGAEAADFRSYLNLLQGSGYTKYEENQIGDNLFATYLKNNILISVGYTPWDGSLRIVSETCTILPQASYVPSEKVARAQITQLSFDESVRNRGMGYVITLEDGSYLIVDGGMNQAGGGGQDEVMLYNYLQNHNQRTDGKIVIAAWVFTHEHDDHVALFLDFAELYAKSVTLESVLWNFTQSYWDGAAGNYYNRICSAIARFGAKSVRVHTGQTAWVRNAKLEILYTHESLAPYYISTVTTLNDASTVFRVDIAGKRILFLGDVSTVLQKDSAVKVIYAMYGSELKCDIMQVGHHGWSGGSIEIYDAARPEIAFWPIESFNWEKVCKYETSKHILRMYESGIIRELYIAKDGEATVLLE